MGLGGYLAARSDAEHYASERRREQVEVVQKPRDEVREVQEVFEEYGLNGDEIEPIIAAFKKHPENWVDFMMRFELGLERPDPKRALRSGATIAGSYIVGGLIPLAPYMLLSALNTALVVSILITLGALAVFGYIKGRFTGVRPLQSAWQTVLIGGVAAAAAFGLASLFS
jgi:VIT1/CCC1 family predicted Fe2+/Mn2+ transporter